MSNRGAMSSTETMQEQGKYVFSLETQAILGKMLRVHIDVEYECEKMRQSLARSRVFNSHQVFMVLDRDSDGYITMDEFRRAFRDTGKYPTERELVGLMSRYDKNKDGRVSYSEFEQEISPKIFKALA